MALETGIWSIQDGKPTRMQATGINYEQRLEDILVRDLSIVAEPRKWMVIGRQVITDHGGRIDLLAIDGTGSLVVLELKRDRTDREVVSQALDYGAWVADLDYPRIAEIFEAYAAKSRGGASQSLEAAFKAFFGTEIPEEVNSSHEMVIVASDLHPESERVARYLRDTYDVPISAVFFTFFADGGSEYLSRSWAVEPVSSDPGPKRATRWNGEYYASFGYPKDVVEAGLKYGFFVAGGGDWYTRSMDLLTPGDRVWVHLGTGKGFGGVARVQEPRVPVDDFTVSVDGKDVPLTEAVRSPELRKRADDPEKATYAVRLEWIHKVPYDKGTWEKGFLANQNTVARPSSEKWDYTVNRLKALWGVGDE